MRAAMRASSPHALRTSAQLTAAQRAPPLSHTPRFHGEGMLIFKDCGKFTGTWERGVVVSGEYAFKDGLAYDEKPSWDYCNGDDRTFFRERVEGLRPADDEQLTNEHPPRHIPKGCYDIGRGYYSPLDGLVYAYDDDKLIGGLFMGETEAWIKSNCRVGC